MQGSPVLLRNLCPTSPSLSPTTLFFHSSPFGSGPPAIPTAKAVAVARVASPISVDRAYQPAFLRALRTYFNNSRRLVKHGDLIAVGINTSLVGTAQNGDDEVEGQDADQK